MNYLIFSEIHRRKIRKGIYRAIGTITLNTQANRLRRRATTENVR
jgi:hypothetical protein